jgi:uncharacterized protein with FMN-binding domain
MKRALLIAGGTVGGLGAVLAITPPQLSGTSSINIAGGSVIGTTGTGSSASASSSSTSSTATASKSARPVATKKANPTNQASGAPTQPNATNGATPTATATQTTAPVTSTVKDGTFTGPAIFVNYGTVQVKITVTNGKVVDAVAVKAPTGKNDRYTKMAVPILKAQTLQAQSANIQGASGASYTSYGWFTSLQGALTDAGF